MRKDVEGTVKGNKERKRGDRQENSAEARSDGRKRGSKVVAIKN